MVVGAKLRREATSGIDFYTVTGSEGTNRYGTKLVWAFFLFTNFFPLFFFPNLKIPSQTDYLQVIWGLGVLERDSKERIGSRMREIERKGLFLGIEYSIRKRNHFVVRKKNIWVLKKVIKKKEWTTPIARSSSLSKLDRPHVSCYFYAIFHQWMWLQSLFFIIRYYASLTFFLNSAKNWIFVSLPGIFQRGFFSSISLVRENDILNDDVYSKLNCYYPY